MLDEKDKLLRRLENQTAAKSQHENTQTSGKGSFVAEFTLSITCVYLLDSENGDVSQQQAEMVCRNLSCHAILFVSFQPELRENLTSLTNQLDETIRSWQQFEQKQLELLKNLLPFSNKTSLEDIIQEIIVHINQLTNELKTAKENESELNHRFEQLREESQMEGEIFIGKFIRLNNIEYSFQTSR